MIFIDSIEEILVAGENAAVYEYFLDKTLKYIQNEFKFLQDNLGFEKIFLSDSTGFRGNYWVIGLAVGADAFEYVYKGEIVNRDNVDQVVGDYVDSLYKKINVFDFIQGAISN